MKLASITFIKVVAIGFCMVAAWNAGAQGCVAVRPMSCSSSGPSVDFAILKPGESQVSASYRYFKSFRHFRGDVEQIERLEEGTEVINIAHSADFGFTYAFAKRFSMTLNVPFISYDRSSMYEHYGNNPASNPDRMRFTTSARGVGDVRLSGYYWLFDPDNKELKGNMALGLGIKAPTGNENVMGDFHRIASNGSDSTFQRPVDQSIQLGDGGWGFTIESQVFRTIFRNTSFYFNGFYMFNPKETNQTLRRGTYSNNDPIANYHSVADQYAARLGLSYAIIPRAGLSASLGGRIEGVPSHDIIGGSNGYRRPGYVVCIDPGATWVRGNLTVAATVPIAMYRNRTKSVSDLSDPTGQSHGDAAFADYQVNAQLSYRFARRDHEGMPATQ